MTIYLLKSQKAGRKPFAAQNCRSKASGSAPKCSSSTRIVQYLYLIGVVAVSMTVTGVLRATVTPIPRLGPPERLLQLHPGQVALRSLSLPPPGQKFGQYLRGSASASSWVKQVTTVTTCSWKKSEPSQLVNQAHALPYHLTSHEPALRAHKCIVLYNEPKFDKGVKQIVLVLVLGLVVLVLVLLLLLLLLLLLMQHSWCKPQLAWRTGVCSKGFLV